MHGAVRVRVAAAALAVLGTVPLGGQSRAQMATSLGTLAKYPAFYQSKTVVIVADATRAGDAWRVPMGATQTLAIVAQTGTPPSRAAEFHGVLVDLGRLAQDDSRVTLYSLRRVVDTLAGGQWPARDTLFALLGATWRDAPDAGDTTLRAIALSPEKFEGRTVIVRGRFRGRNLYADLPAWPKQSNDDFVLQSADAALWVTGLKAKGKSFEFDTSSRRDTNRWLAATGVLRIDQGLPRVEARALEAIPAPADDLPPDAPAPRVVEPPPAVVFSLPLDGQTDISPAAPIRIQFSRAMAPASFDGHVRLTYGAGVTAAPPEFKVVYSPQNITITLTLAAPLAPDADVIVELDGVVAAGDGIALPKTRITFRTAR